MSHPLSEGQLVVLLSQAIGSQPSRRDEKQRYIEWRLSNATVLRADFSADVVLIRRSWPPPPKRGKGKGAGRFIIKLADGAAKKQLTEAVKTLTKSPHFKRK